jgi:hypothetical protein
MIRKIKKTLAALTLMAVSAAIGLLLSEFGSRLVLNAGNYLSVEMVPDRALGAVVSPGTRLGFDAWGFRNPKVAESADIVAVGDSHTYGNTATMDQSWPYVLAQLTGQRVYNMGMGGYGPNQYFYLLKNRALSLNPKVIICGLYMGDDFENAYSITYGLDYWASLRSLQLRKANYKIWDTAPVDVSRNKKARVWLSQHSVIYQLVFHGPLMGLVQGEYQIRHAAELYPGAATTLDIPEKNILEAFRPEGLAVRLDQHSAAVQEGMRITFELLKEMKDLCDQHQIRFVVLVIPTKEQVFSEYLERESRLPLNNILETLISNERIARKRTFEFLDQTGIRYVDGLPALKTSLKSQLYARTAADMHPNRNGYRVIAEAVSRELRVAGGHDLTVPPGFVPPQPASLAGR